MAENIGDLRILIVDDDAILRRIVGHVLESLGVNNVDGASSGEEGLATLENKPNGFDLVFCDLNMPGMDGIEFLRHMSRRGLSCGVVLLSGVDKSIIDTAADLASVHGLDVVGSLEKPVTSEAVHALLTKALAPRAGQTQHTADLETSEIELRDAIGAEEFVPYFQPKVNIKTRELHGVEALLRWQKPDGSTGMPGSFIPVAEDCGLIFDLTKAVFPQALGWGGRWLLEGLQVKVAVNVSVESLIDIDFVDFVVEQANNAGLYTSQVIVEVTESRLMQDVASALEILTRLRLKGIGLAIDDYGTGFSSMEHLKRIPFTELKIDRAFINGASKDPQARAMLESSVNLAKALELELVAEGVETQEDWDLLERLGVDLAQGYFVAKPMPGEEIGPWQSRWQAQA